jgi:hypothetical protein
MKQVVFLKSGNWFVIEHKWAVADNQVNETSEEKSRVFVRVLDIDTGGYFIPLDSVEAVVPFDSLCSISESVIAKI